MCCIFSLFFCLHQNNMWWSNCRVNRSSLFNGKETTLMNDGPILPAFLPTMIYRGSFSSKEGRGYPCGIPIPQNSLSQPPMKRPLKTATCWKDGFLLFSSCHTSSVFSLDLIILSRCIGESGINMRDLTPWTGSQMPVLVVVDVVVVVILITICVFALDFTQWK